MLQNAIVHSAKSDYSFPSDSKLILSHRTKSESAFGRLVHFVVADAVPNDAASLPPLDLVALMDNVLFSAWETRDHDM